MNFGNLVGQTLDGKYKIERELGKGGMGAVYLSTHIGTERPVAVKVIVPEFMERAEFVERFRREARAAGRLRHPNVVDVTDFGIAETPNGRIAYLVMEYLDGCTLGEVLEEEKHLPLDWTIDILEQVCSAVQEAHQQGIIHRDLKPDNIWLEPNQRGGYTVKVLDFGIAKLETQGTASKINLPGNLPETARRASTETVPDQSGTLKKTLVGADSNLTFAGNKDLTAATEAETLADNGKNTKLFESKTLVQTDESSTLLFADEQKNADSEATLIQNAEENYEQKNAVSSLSEEKNTPTEDFVGTKLLSSSDLSDKIRENSIAEKTNLRGKTTQELTRVGSVLGTPLYMSPEQCRGEHLTPQSDIYSLGVIAYQMLGGKTPFEGNFTEVMEAHKSEPPPPLKAKRVSRRLKKLISAAMAKKPEDRPKSAEAFATVLRAQSEGLGALYRQAITIYGEHLPKFLLISTFVLLPVTLFSVTPQIFTILKYFEMMESVVLDVIGGILTALSTFAGFFFGAIGFGTATLLIARHLSAPLRPLDLKSAFSTVRQKWKALLGWIFLTSIFSIIGIIFCFVPGIYLASRFAFVTPAIVMEDLRGRAALKRSNQLFKRSPWKVAVLTTANFILPVIVSTLIMIFIASIIGNIPSDNQFLRGMGARKTIDTIIREREEKKEKGVETKPEEEGVKIEGSTRSAPNVTYNTTEETEDSSNDREKEKLTEADRYARSAGESVRLLLFQLIWFPVAVFITSFTQVLMALMYVRMRQAGGEPRRDLLIQFEGDDKPQSRWQSRIHNRLLQSGKITGKHKG